MVHEHPDPEGWWQVSTIVLDIACMDLLQDAHGNYIAPDFKAAYAAGVRGVYLRRSWTYFDHGHQSFRMCHDPCAEFADAARAAGLHVGYYLFPDFTKGAPSPVEQCANFDAAGGTIVRGLDFPVCLDVEFPGNGIADTRRTQTEVLELVREFVVELARLYGCAPAIYSSHVEMHDDNGLGLSATSSLPWLSVCPLWQKTPYRVAPGQPFDQVMPPHPHEDAQAWDRLDLWRTPAPWRGLDCFLQQFQGDCRSIAGVHQCDVSYFWIPGAWCRTRLGATSVVDFQAAHNLQADGIVGLHTFCAIAWS